jgi:hypothetical protein
VGSRTIRACIAVVPGGVKDDRFDSGLRPNLFGVHGEFSRVCTNHGKVSYFLTFMVNLLWLLLEQLAARQPTGHRNIVFIF